MSSILLFDLASKGGNACWSPNPWKTRLALNYKGLEYETQWVEYPDVGSSLKQLNGIEPNENGAAYTIPAIRLPSDKNVMDSRKIATELEKQFPQPSLHLDSPLLPKIEELIGKAFMAAAPDLMPEIPKKLLNEVSVVYFERTRAQRFGAPLAELQKTKGGETAWNAAKPHFQEIAALLKEQGGPYLMGETVSYADFYIASFMQCTKRLGMIDHICSVDPCFEKLYDACSQWLKRDDH